MGRAAAGPVHQPGLHWSLTLSDPGSNSLALWHTAEALTGRRGMERALS